MRILAFALSLAAAVPAQLVINEIHGFGAGAVPALPGDFLELWNQGATTIDLTGCTVTIWNGDAGVTQSTVVPGTGVLGNHLVPPGCFWLFQESPVANLGQPLTGTLAGKRGMRGLTAAWTSTGNNGCRVTDAGGACLAYVYLRRGITAAPSPSPNLLPPCIWTPGNVAASATASAHLYRKANVNTNSPSDWAQDFSTIPGTPGAINTGVGATQTPLQAPRWQVNSAASHFDADGATTDGSRPLLVTKCVNGVALLHLQSTLIGSGFDVGIVAGPGLPGFDVCTGINGGGIATLGGQLVNLHVASPSLVFLNGLSLAPFTANLTLPFASAVPIAALSAQMFVVDGTHADGLRISALVQIGFSVPVPLAAPQPGPQLDDDFVSVVAGCVPFYGAAYTNFFVNANGRVTFLRGSTDFLVSPPSALVNEPFVGAWCDLSPNLGGTITITSPTPTSFRADYALVPYFNAIGANSFSITLDAGNGVITLGGLGGLGPNLDLMFLGMSKGLDATDPGPQTFTPGPASNPALGTDMIYDFGPEGSITSGFTSLVFTPILTGPLAPSYSVAAF